MKCQNCPALHTSRGEDWSESECLLGIGEGNKDLDHLERDFKGECGCAIRSRKLLERYTELHCNIYYGQYKYVTDVTADGITEREPTPEEKAQDEAEWEEYNAIYERLKQMKERANERK